MTSHLAAPSSLINALGRDLIAMAILAGLIAGVAHYAAVLLGCGQARIERATAYGFFASGLLGLLLVTLDAIFGN